MSLDSSLKSSSKMGGHRNVLTRAERILKLGEKGRFKHGATDPVHLPKVANRKIAVGKKVKKRGPEEEGAEAAAGAAGAAPAAGAAGKAAAPAAKPAAGAKAAKK